MTPPAPDPNRRQSAEHMRGFRDMFASGSSFDRAVTEALNHFADQLEREADIADALSKGDHS